MAQYEMNLRDYWVIVRRRRMIIIISTVLVALLSLWLARQQVPTYEATAAVKYEQSTSVSGLLVEVLSYSSADSIETQANLIKSYPILEGVARRLGKLPDVPGGAARHDSREPMAVLDSLGRRIRTSRVPSTSVIEITATSPNPREARDLANTVAETYRDYNRAVRNARITEARKFIEAQLKEVEARVKRAEEEVWAFREANRIISPGAESSMLMSLFTQLRGDIEQARRQRTELELAQSRLTKPDANGVLERVYVDSSNPALQKLQATQVDLMIERNNLALEVTGRHPRLQALEDRLREVREEMRREIAAQITLLKSREEILNRQMSDLFQKNREVPVMELGLQRLERDAKINADLLTLLKTKHQEALIKEAEGVEEVTLIRPATEPTAPVGGASLNVVFVGAILGLMLGLVLAFVQETLDTSIGTIEDVESYLQVPVLGVIPHIDAREAMRRLVERRPAFAGMEGDALQAHALLITHFDPKSPVAEAYRTLRTNIQFMRAERAGKALVVTSPTLQEGKTTTIVNLALTMAQNGQRTLLIGANLRRPSIHRFFGIEREPGLSNILVGTTDWHDCIRTVADILMGRFEMEDIMASPGLDNLHIIESGAIPANPSELLASPAMGDFLRAVRAEYDIVLIDTPPVLPVTDSALVAAQVDGAILVYQAGKVGRLVLKRAKAHLESTRGKVWGVVLNDVQAEIAGYTYAHYYTHYYGEETRTPARSPVTRALDTVRSGLGRWLGRAGPPPAAETAAEPRPPAADSPTRGPGNYRNTAGRLVLLAALLAALGVLVGWQLGWFGAEMRPRELMREKLEAPGAPPTPPAPRRAPPQSLSPPVGPSGPAAVAPAPVARLTPPMPPTPPPAPAAPEASVAPPAPSAPSEAPVAALPAAPGPPPVARATPPAAAPKPAPARFAVEFGPFLVSDEAERAERQLNRAGHQTVRFRQQTGAALYAVLIESVATAAEAATLVTRLRADGFPEPVAVGGGARLEVRVGDPVILRGAVRLAERLKAQGHLVRIAAQPGEAVTFTIRHGNFASREEAEARSVELAGLGLGNHVVRVK